MNVYICDFKQFEPARIIDREWFEETDGSVKSDAPGAIEEIIKEIDPDTGEETERHIYYFEFNRGKIIKKTESGMPDRYYITYEEQYPITRLYRWEHLNYDPSSGVHSFYPCVPNPMSSTDPALEKPWHFEVAGVINDYTSIIWDDAYDEEGTVQLYVQATEENRKLFKPDRYLMIPDSSKIMVIEKTTTDPLLNNGNILQVFGRSLESVLDRRCVFPGVALNTSDFKSSENYGAIRAAHYLFDSFFINPIQVTAKNTSSGNDDYYYPQRRVVFMTHDVEDDIKHNNLLDLKPSCNKTVSKDSLLDTMKTLCKENNLGFSIEPRQRLGSLAVEWVFSVYTGADRSFFRSNPSETDPLIFSPRFGNVSSMSVTKDHTNYKNVVMCTREKDCDSFVDLSNMSMSNLSEMSGFGSFLGNFELISTIKTWVQGKLSGLISNSKTAGMAIYYLLYAASLTDQSYDNTVENIEISPLITGSGKERKITEIDVLNYDYLDSIGNTMGRKFKKCKDVSNQDSITLDEFFATTAFGWLTSSIISKATELAGDTVTVYGVTYVQSAVSPSILKSFFSILSKYTSGYSQTKWLCSVYEKDNSKVGIERREVCVDEESDDNEEWNNSKMVQWMNSNTLVTEEEDNGEESDEKILERLSESARKQSGEYADDVQVDVKCDTSELIYGGSYDLGDIIQIDDGHGTNETQIVKKVTIAHDTKNGITIVPTFEKYETIPSQYIRLDYLGVADMMLPAEFCPLKVEEAAYSEDLDGCFHWRNNVQSSEYIPGLPESRDTTGGSFKTCDVKDGAQVYTEWLPKLKSILSKRSFIWTELEIEAAHKKSGNDSSLGRQPDTAIVSTEVLYRDYDTQSGSSDGFFPMYTPLLVGMSKQTNGGCALTPMMKPYIRDDNGNELMKNYNTIPFNGEYRTIASQYGKYAYCLLGDSKRWDADKKRWWHDWGCGYAAIEKKVDPSDPSLDTNTWISNRKPIRKPITGSNDAPLEDFVFTKEMGNNTSDDDNFHKYFINKAVKLNYEKTVQENGEFKIEPKEILFTKSYMDNEDDVLHLNCMTHPISSIYDNENQNKVLGFEHMPMASCDYFRAKEDHTPPAWPEDSFKKTEGDTYDYMWPNPHVPFINEYFYPELFYKKPYGSSNSSDSDALKFLTDKLRNNLILGGLKYRLPATAEQLLSETAKFRFSSNFCDSNNGTCYKSIKVWETNANAVRVSMPLLYYDSIREGTTSSSYKNLARILNNYVEASNDGYGGNITLGNIIPRDLSTLKIIDSIVITKLNDGTNRQKFRLVNELGELNPGEASWELEDWKTHPNSTMITKEVFVDKETIVDGILDADNGKIITNYVLYFKADVYRIINGVTTQRTNQKVAITQRHEATGITPNITRINYKYLNSGLYRPTSEEVTDSSLIGKYISVTGRGYDILEIQKSNVDQTQYAPVPYVFAPDQIFDYTLIDESSKRLAHEYVPVRLNDDSEDLQDNEKYGFYDKVEKVFIPIKWAPTELGSTNPHAIFTQAGGEIHNE